jgi:hypothetical protein
MPSPITNKLFGIQTIAPTTNGNFVFSYNAGTKLATNSQVHILVDGTNYVGVGNITIILPPISSFANFWNISINVVDISNTATLKPITIVPSGGNNINGDPSIGLTNNGNTVTLMIASGNSWYSTDSSGGGGGGGGISVITTTYATFHANIISGGLVAGNIYRITDYQSVNWLNGYDQAVSNPPIQPNFDPREIYTSSNEVILVKAISPYETEPIAYSEAYPQDLLTYNPYLNDLCLNTYLTGQNLQWNGTNVYYDLPTPFIFGSYLYMYAQFFGGADYFDVNYNCVLPIETPATSINISGGISATDVFNITIVNGGTRIIFNNLTFADFTNFDANTFEIEYAEGYNAGQSKGFVISREDTALGNKLPLDYRNIVYRRWEIDLSSIGGGNAFCGLEPTQFNGYAGTGNYLDYPVLGIDPVERNLMFIGANLGVQFSNSDNFVMTSTANNSIVRGNIRSCTFDYFENCDVVSVINSYINLEAKSTYSIAYNTSVSLYFSSVGQFSNNAGINFSYFNCEYLCQFNIGDGGTNIFNVKADGFSDNVLGNLNMQNCVFGSFSNNTIYSNTTFIENEFSGFWSGNFFGSPLLTPTLISRNKGGSGGNGNVISDDFKDNFIGTGFGGNGINNEFTGNHIGNNFGQNSIANTGKGFTDNLIGNNFSFNEMNDSFQRNQIGCEFVNNEILNVFNGNIIDGSFGNNICRGSFSNNTFGVTCNDNDFSITTLNRVGSTFSNNILSDFFTQNFVGDNFLDNNIGDNFENNRVGNEFDTNTIGTGCQNNDFGNSGFNTNTIGNNFNNNIFQGLAMNGTDWTVGATRVYASYACIIFQDSGGGYRLQYYDTGLASIQYVSPTS